MKEYLLSKHNLGEFWLELQKALENDEVLLISSKPPVSSRTQSQNKAMHKYFSMLADTLNNAGLDMQTVLSEGTSIPWSAEKVKEDIWKTVQKALLNKNSTTKLETNEVAQVYDVVNRHLSEKFGVVVPFPCEDELMREAIYGSANGS